MAKGSCSLLLVMAVCLLILPSAAQPADSLKTTERRSPLVSGFLEWAVPMAGYAYAGNLKRGILPNVVRISGFVIFYRELMSESSTLMSDLDPTVAIGGYTMAMAGTAWAITGAVITANQRNSQIQRAGTHFELGFGVNCCPSIRLCIPL